MNFLLIIFLCLFYKSFSFIIRNSAYSLRLCRVFLTFFLFNPEKHLKLLKFIIFYRTIYHLLQPISFHHFIFHKPLYYIQNSLSFFYNNFHALLPFTVTDFPSLVCPSTVNSLYFSLSVSTPL